MKCQEVFENLYRREPEDVAFCPYRVCPMGAHSDHQFGKVTGLAIDKGVSIAYGPKKTARWNFPPSSIPNGLPRIRENRAWHME